MAEKPRAMLFKDVLAAFRRNFESIHPKTPEPPTPSPEPISDELRRAMEMRRRSEVSLYRDGADQPSPSPVSPTPSRGQYWLDRQAAHRSVPATGSPPPPELPPPKPPHGAPMHPEDKRFFIKTGVWAAVLVTTLGVGLAAFIGNGSRIGAAIALGSFVLLVMLTRHLSERRLVSWAPSLAMGMLVLTWGYLGYLWWTSSPLFSRPAQIIVQVGPTSDELLTRIEHLEIQNETIGRQLDAARKEQTVLKEESDAASKNRDTEKKELENKGSQIAGLETQLKTAREQLATAKRDLDNMHKATAKASDTTYIPTHIRLQFNTAGYRPVEIAGDTANIHWSWAAFTEKHALQCTEPNYPWLCFAIPPRGDKNDIQQNIVILTLVFDKPITYKDVKIETNGAPFKYPLVDHTDRFVIIELYPDPANFVLEVEMTPP